jgi:hypothetical protein
VNDRLLVETFADALRPVLAELVAEEVERQLAARGPEEPPPYDTVAQYARKTHATPAAVRARIRRGTLEAVKPPGAREWLIPNGDRPKDAD